MGGMLPYPYTPTVAHIDRLTPKDEALSTRQRSTAAACRLLELLLNNHIELAHLNSGKPFLSNYACSLSIAHSEHYVAVLIAPAALFVGIDIEEPREKLLTSAPRFMHHKELAHFHSLAGKPEAMEYALQVWCAKEAAFKAIPHASAGFASDYLLDNGYILYFPTLRSFPVNFYRSRAYLLASVCTAALTE